MRVTFEYVLSQSLQENSQKLFEYEDKQNDRQKHYRAGISSENSYG